MTDPRSLPSPSPPPLLSPDQSLPLRSSSPPQSPLLRTIPALENRPLTSTSSPIEPWPTSDHTAAVSSHSASSSSRTGGSAIGKASSSSASAVPADAIEMEPIVNSHRRRKSSLMGPPLSIGPGRPGAGSSEVEEGGSRRQSMARNDFARDSFSDDGLQDDEETGLTDKDRRRRQKRKRRNTLLDQRVIREKDFSPDEHAAPTQSIGKRIAVNSTLILLWYLFSLSLSVYNKWMFDEDKLGFSFPLFTTSMHMVVQFLLSGLVLYFIPSLRPGGGRPKSDDEPQGPLMTKMFYLTRITPCGATTGLDIGLGNTSLKFISLTFYTMCKSSSLAFVLVFAFAFRLEQPTWRLVAIIATMTLGVVLMVFGEVEFKLGGFVLVIGAAFFSGLRWALTQILMLRNPATSNPFSSIFYLTPVMFIVLFSLAIPVEGFGPLWEGLKVLSTAYGVFMTPLFLMFPGCIAFLMTAAEFALLQRTSVVTLSIAGIFKEVVTISAASVVFKDKLTVINVFGLLVTLVAIITYNYVKIMKMREEAKPATHERLNQHDDSRTSFNANDFDLDESSGGESGGLLRRASHDVDEPIVTASGDISPNLMSSPTDDHRESKSRSD